jgi:hypothetical protein
VERLRGFLQEMVDQQGEVLPTGAQRRNLDVMGAQPIVEVLTKQPGGDALDNVVGYSHHRYKRLPGQPARRLMGHGQIVPGAHTMAAGLIFLRTPLRGGLKP